MCGLVCSGKTTVAKRLADELRAIRLSRDEWMLRLHGLPYDDPDYVARLPACTDLMWDVALQSLALGTSVVLDWNHWNRAARSESRRRATAARADFVLHHVDVPVEVAVGRAARRKSAKSAEFHQIYEGPVRHFATIFELPEPAEGLEIVRHAARAGLKR